MRKLKLISVFAALVILAVPGQLPAEDDILPNGAGTKIELFLSRKGQLMVKDVFLLGKVSGLYSSSGDISAIITYQPDDKDNRLKGLIFKVNEGQSDERSHLSYLDIEEIEGLSNGIASMIRMSEERDKTDNSYTELFYTTNSGLSFGIYLGETEKEGFITAAGTEKLTIIMKPEKLGEVKKIVDYGNTLLKMK